MAYVTRAMRERARDDAREANHPEWAQQRIRQREIAAQVVAETAERFGMLTAENAREALDWQTARQHELETQAGLR